MPLSFLLFLIYYLYLPTFRLLHCFLNLIYTNSTYAIYKQAFLPTYLILLNGNIFLLLVLQFSFTLNLSLSPLDNASYIQWLFLLLLEEDVLHWESQTNDLPVFTPYSDSISYQHATESLSLIYDGHLGIEWKTVKLHFLYFLAARILYMLLVQKQMQSQNLCSWNWITVRQVQGIRLAVVHCGWTVFWTLWL